jgi:hypothetical protein
VNMILRMTIMGDRGDLQRARQQYQTTSGASSNGMNAMLARPSIVNCSIRLACHS